MYIYYIDIDFSLSTVVVKSFLLTESQLPSNSPSVTPPPAQQLAAKPTVPAMPPSSAEVAFGTHLKLIVRNVSVRLKLKQRTMIKIA